MLVKRTVLSAILIWAIGVGAALSQSVTYSTDLFLDTNRDWAQVQAEVIRERLYLRDTFTRDMKRVSDQQARDMARFKGADNRDARRRARFHAKAERARLREAYRYRWQELQDKMTWARREYTLRRKYSAGTYRILNRDDLARDPVLPSISAIPLAR
ncbi:hypothetical protein [Actibacterium ureilyticum]|uniref:hypothetical protein n=1 Tax=Actibacterium ureilyticum TaxID=1590614 RepID=UPI000BAB1291|nr:hypothetical protein [Actibacterium ureilyticum]